MNTLEMLEVFGHWFWEFATCEQVAEVREHEYEAAECAKQQAQRLEIQCCEELANPV